MCLIAVIVLLENNTLSIYGQKVKAGGWKGWLSSTEQSVYFCILVYLYEPAWSDTIK